MPKDEESKGPDMEAYEAGADSALESILGLSPEETAEQTAEQDQDAESEDLEPDNGEDEEWNDDWSEDDVDDEEGEEEAEELDDEPTADDEDDLADSGVTEEQVFDAELVLRRGKIPVKLIKGMSDTEKVELAAGLRPHQAEVDRAFSERNALAKKLGLDAEEADSGQEPGSGHPREGAADPGATGATLDLTEAALPFAERIAEMDDPKKVASALADFTSKAVQSQTGTIQQQLAAMQAQMQPLMMQQIRDRLGPGFEGDVEKLVPQAQALAQVGMHADKSGLDKAAALIRAAHVANGGKITSQGKKRTSRARRNGAKPPVKARRTPPRKMSSSQKEDIRIQRIMNGERDAKRINEGL